MKTIYAVDDSEEYLDALRQIFKHSGEFDLIGTYSQVQSDDGVEDMVETIEALNPDIVLMDFSFVQIGRPRDFGIDLIQEIFKIIPDQTVLMLVGDDQDPDDTQLEKIKRSFHNGAGGYLRKSNPNVWFEGIRETLNGGTFVGKELKEIIVKNLKQYTALGMKERELEVIIHLSQDLTVRKVAEKMNITPDGVNFHIGNAKVKLKVKTLQGLVGKAAQLGII